MRYHITPKQAKEVSQDTFYSFFDELAVRKDWANYHHRKMAVGKMLSLLEGKAVITREGESGWRVEVADTSYLAAELVDALWEAIKYQSGGA